MTNKDKQAVRKIRTAAEVIDFINEEYETNSIRFNVRTTEIELNKKSIDLNTVRAYFGKKHRIDISQDLLAQCLVLIAKENEYDPVKEYLDSVNNKQLVKENFYETFCGKVFRIKNRLYIEYIKIWSMGVVARIFDAGCKVDQALILQGSQGIGKSSFFRKIIGNEFFTDSLCGDPESKDQKLLIRKYAICEWSELDKIFGNDKNSKVKACLSSQFDDYRPPYGKATERVPRRSVLVGTTNEQVFLSDPTGNRRYWVVKCTNEINLKEVESLKEAFWSNAIYHYKNNPDTEDWISDELKQLQKEDVKQFEYEDPWLEIVEEYVNTKLDQDPNNRFTTEEFLSDTPNGIGTTKQGVLRDFEDCKNDKSCSNRLGKILRKIGLERKVVKVLGKSKKLWVKKN